MLWIDDSPEWVQSVQPQIEDHLQSLGFSLEAISRTSGEDITAVLASIDGLDLIAIDLNLPQMKGSEVITTLRANEKFLPILFYSEGGIPQGENVRVDGVYYSDRQDFESKLQGIVDTHIQITQQVNVMRGIVIAETIEIEDMIEQCIVKFFEEKGEIFLSKVLRKENLYDFKKKVDLFNSFLSDQIADLNSKMSGKGVSEADKKTFSDRLAFIKPIKDAAKKLEEEVVSKRNILAHARSVFENGKRVIKSHFDRQKPVVLDSAGCLDIRLRLKAHTANLKALMGDSS
jgi:CheY-like chemotaxis protein